MKFKILGPFVILVFTVVSFTAAKHLGAQDAAQRIEISARRYQFTPSEFSVKKGVPVTIALTSEDIAHGIKFEEPKVTLIGKKGETREVTFTPTQVGDFIGQCASFCGDHHGDMRLTMHVTE